MKPLFNFRNKIEDLYYKSPGVIGYIIRFALVFLSLFALRESVGYSQVLSHFVFIIVFAAVCSFIPMRLLTLMLALYLTIQTFSLSAGIGIVTVIFVLLMYMLCYRFDERYGFAIMLAPLLCIIRLPLLLPLILAIISGPGAIISVLVGMFTYYYIHYLHIYTAVYQGMTDTEIVKMSSLLNGIFQYGEMWYIMGCMTVAFFLTWILKKININRSAEVAISVGTGVYLILNLLSSLFMNSMTYNKLIWYVVSAILSCLLAILISGLYIPLDYGRTELLEFEDDEYKYFVRAVPKVSVTRESVRIKRIYARKQLVQSKGREEKT